MDFSKKNRPLESPNSFEINQTDYINFQVPYNLSLKLNSLTIKKFVYISSIAAANPRRKITYTDCQNLNLKKQLALVTAALIY